MVPAALVVLDPLPLTPNGKLDRPRCPPPGPARPAAAREPATAAEAALLGVFRDVLGTAEVGLDDAFFDLGGDSIVGPAGGLPRPAPGPDPDRA